ncbi:MAG: hypothetical protein WAS55_00110 [Saprospiraceae bacterium]
MSSYCLLYLHSRNLITLFVTLILIFVLLEFKAHGQCTPPMSETCQGASVLCSLTELNGYTCNNSSTIASPCNPLCSQGGISSNTSWWALVSEGGNVTISLTIGSCQVFQGLQFGIWGDCQCGEEIICKSIPCAPPNSVQTINASLTPCKTYYFWIDGCSADLCDFTINTIGGDPPILPPLSNINNVPSRIIQPVCEGACSVLFFVNPLPGGCNPYFVWTLDGDEVPDNSNKVFLDFPDQGDFVLCVTAYIGNPISGSICSQEGPQCATVKVRPIADKAGVQRSLCWSEVNPGGYKWHSQRIFREGFYREQFTDLNCCKFDSIVEFKIYKAANAGRDFKVLGLKTKMNADIAQSGIWTKISGPGNVNFSNPSDPKSRITVTKYGNYTLEWFASSKECTDSDLVSIEFFKIPIKQIDPLQSKTEISNSFSNIQNNLLNNKSTEILISNPISPEGKTNIRIQNIYNSNYANYSWFDISGNKIIEHKIAVEIWNEIYEIKSPTVPGIYFLMVQVEEYTSTYNIEVHDGFKEKTMKH